MTDILVAGDTGPSVTSKLYEEDDPTEPLDLTGDTHVFFQMRRTADRRLMINREANIVGPPSSGEVMYLWAVDDLAIPGDYILEWQVVYPDGTKQTTAIPHEVTVRRR